MKELRSTKDKIIARVMKDVHVDKDGRSYMTMNGLARLAGVAQQSVTEYFNNLANRQKDVFLLDSAGYLTGKNEKYILDVHAFDYLENQLINGNVKPAMTLALFAKVGFRFDAKIAFFFLTTIKLRVYWHCY